MSYWTLTIREFRIWHGAKVCQLLLVIFKVQGIWKRRKTRRIFSLVYAYLPGYRSSRKGTILITFPQSFIFQERELVKGVGKKTHSSSTFCLLSCNIHSLTLRLSWYANLYIFRFCGHSVLFLWCSCACDIESNLCEHIYSCQYAASLFLSLTYKSQ